MSWIIIFDARQKLDSSALSRFAVWNTMMGTSILSIPWGIKQVISPLNCFGSPTVRGWEPRHWCSRAKSPHSQLHSPEGDQSLFVLLGWFYSGDPHPDLYRPADALLLLHRPPLTKVNM